jgi:hypothetical protein
MLLEAAAVPVAGEMIDVKGARYLLAWVFFAPLCFAQAPAGSSGQIPDLGVTLDANEVRLEIRTSAPGASARIAAVYADQIVLDVSGPPLEKNPRRIRIDRSGVRSVRVWRQSENPPLTRIVVELSAPSTYLLSTTTDRAVLRVGPAIEGGLQAASPAPARAGRSSVSVALAQDIIGIFRRPRPSPPQTASAPPTPPQDQSATAAAQPPRSQEVETAVNAPSRPQDFTPPPPPVAEKPKPAEPTASAEPAAKLPEQPAPAQPPAPEPSKPIETAASVIPAPPQPERQAPPLPPAAKASEPAQPAQPAVIEPAAQAEPETSPKGKDSVAVPSSSNPNSASQVSAPAAAPATASATSANPQELSPAPSDSDSAPATEPEGPRPISQDEMRLLEAAANSGIRSVFHVKHVERDAAYLDGGRSSGLEEGMKLVVKEKQSSTNSNDKDHASAEGPVAELVVVGLAETSAVTEIHTPKRPVVPGDLAYLSAQDAQTLVQERVLGEARKYPVVVSFTDGSDPMDEEARAEVPRPPLPSVNRARGRFGVDYLGTISHNASAARSSDLGLVFRADITRMAGTYWNLSGYWRGRFNSRSSASQPTLQDLINRTYHLSLTYDNPNSRWVAGFGRLYVPWASSLDTIDGGYFGRRLSEHVTSGIFAGTTPDPTSWNYNPDRRLSGAFINFQGGSFESFRFTSTSGAGASLLKWQMDRPFIVFENALSYKHSLSIYHSLQADSPRGNPAVPAPGPGVSRSFLTVRLDPHPRLEFSVNHTFFRDIPTFDPQLVGTGLLDKYLFQGVSAGARVEVIKQIFLYTDLGRSNRTGDAKTSLNQMYGITFGRLPRVGLRADARYSRFHSSFGDGTYRALSLSRSVGDSFHFDVLLGDQSLASTLAGNQSARFVTTLLDTSLGSRFFLIGGFTFYRGQLQNYDQWNVTLGYRFDTSRPHW